MTNWPKNFEQFGIHCLANYNYAYKLLLEQLVGKLVDDCVEVR